MAAVRGILHRVKLLSCYRYMQLQTASVFESERKQADDEYDVRAAKIAYRISHLGQNDKLNVKEEMLMILQERQKKLEEEKNTLVLTDGTQRKLTLGCADLLGSR